MEGQKDGWMHNAKPISLRLQPGGDYNGCDFKILKIRGPFCLDLDWRFRSLLAIKKMQTSLRIHRDCSAPVRFVLQIIIIDKHSFRKIMSA